jgi:DNA-binding transcriptional ArsR family regulator
MEDSLFRALADPTRRKILELLAKQDRTAGEIAEQFPMAFASVSHHLGVLKAADLVATAREGQFIRYRLNTTVFQDMMRYFMTRFGAGEDGGGGEEGRKGDA